MRLSEKFLYHCAPVLAGVKSANTFTLIGEEIEKSQDLFSKWDVNYKILYAGSERELLLIYKEEKLKLQLSKEDNKHLLQEFNYADYSLDSCLKQLTARVHTYYDKRSCFPHELGCFLDYPAYDIRSFVNNKGKNYIYCGYWKVYDHLEYAKKLFAAYDHARLTRNSLSRP